MVFEVLMYMILFDTAVPMDRQGRYIDIHFIDEKMEAQKIEITCSESHS